MQGSKKDPVIEKRFTLKCRCGHLVVFWKTKSGDQIIECQSCGYTINIGEI